MTSQEFGYVDAIIEHSAGFADAAARDLTAPVEHCPEWNVADLIHHLTEVQWFWATIAAERLTEPPNEKPARATDDQLISTFTAGADRLADVLRRTPYRDRAWTWAPRQQDVGFIARHQVQEAAVHHWDAAHATGTGMAIAATPAADAVDEFLTFSVSGEDYQAERPPLDGTFAIRCSDIDVSWTISDGVKPSTVAYTAGSDDALPALTAPAADLLLWLYGRVALDAGGVDPDLLARFRALTFTD